MQYYDVDDILLHESTIKVEFKCRIRNFGFLLSQPRSSIIPENRSVEAPYFLVGFLLRNGYCLLSSELLDDALLNDIRAKASIVDLRSICPYFFLLCSMIMDESKTLSEFFYERLNEHSALLLKETLSEDDMWRMDVMEKSLIVGSRRMLQGFRKFLAACG